MNITTLTKQIAHGFLLGLLCLGTVVPLTAAPLTAVAAVDQGKNKDKEQDRGNKDPRYIVKEPKRNDPQPTPPRNDPPRNDPPRNDPPRDKKKG